MDRPKAGTDLWLGHRDLQDRERRKRQKEAGSKVNGAIIVLDGVTI